MSSFHPLGSNVGSHPLSPAPAGLTFHDDDEDAWTPPSLPGDPHTASGRAYSAARRKNGGMGGNSNTSPLDVPLGPLLNSLPAGEGTYGAGNDGDDLQPSARAAPRQQYDSNDHARPGNFGRSAWGSESAPGGSGGEGTVRPGRSVEPDRNSTLVARRAAQGGETRTLASVHTLRLHTYYAPTFCDACSQLLIGIMQQGLRCEVCGMNIHPECRNTPCSADHRCRPPELVRISAGVDDSRVEGVRLKKGYPSRAFGGMGIFGGNDAARGVAITSPIEDPLDSEWHKILVHNKQLWVPDSSAAGCMVCARPFNVVFRRHHCRRCGACMCGSCSHMAVSDKVLSVNHRTGEVTRLSSGESVRCCTPCTGILDQQLSKALQRKGWGQRNGTNAPDNTQRRSQVSPQYSAGGSYAASLPASSAATEGYDGGGFIPPVAASRGEGTSHAAGFGRSVKPFEDGAAADRFNGNGHRALGDGYLGSSDEGADDPLARSNQLRQSSRSPPPPPPPPRRGEPPTTTEVPSWLGNSTLGSRRAPSGSNASSGRAGTERSGRQKQEDGGAWGGMLADAEEATDWSASGSVV